MIKTTMLIKKIDYGIDAPDLIKTYLLRAILLGSLCIAGLLKRTKGTKSIVFRTINATIGLLGLWWLFAGFHMIFSSLVGKLRARDILLNNLHLEGDEHILDVGCGHGLLMIGAAKRVPKGFAVGVDIWSQVDQGNNSKEVAMKNAQLEGVADRVDILNSDMRKMPFAKETFDAVVACMSIHNIELYDGRYKAIQEIVRVLKIGGQVALLDFRYVEEYANNLRKLGMKDVDISKRSVLIHPNVRTVTATK